MTVYAPEKWLETTVRCLKEYLEREFDRSVSSDEAGYCGLDLYEIVPEFPGPLVDLRKMPLGKTLIHFEIDDIQSGILGFGDNVFQTSFDGSSAQVTGRTGELHIINLDVGIWATDRSGGVTARSRAKQTLQVALGGALGIKKLREFSDGGDGNLELLGFSGGRFVPDRINDMVVYRMIECTLVIRVFSRAPLDDSQVVPGIMDIVQDPHLKIEDDDGTLIELN